MSRSAPAAAVPSVLRIRIATSLQASSPETGALGATPARKVDPPQQAHKTGWPTLDAHAPSGTGQSGTKRAPGSPRAGSGAGGDRLLGLQGLIRMVNAGLDM
ncbi:hypothetical protein GCM10009727_92750 [Actinomadura napierensis]|uniref:Uncharacterized protein n=1 Tax=Actinomadura napierensis TaxID=267854 RepID=A0ABN3AHS3_9ACTN